MKVDVGSGGYKRPGYIGLDIIPPDASRGGLDAPAGVEVDVVCDIEHDRWPFEDNSVTHIFSSHTLEHVQHVRIPYIFSEMSRICADGAEIEIWNPHAFHRDAYVLGHVNFLNEEIYHHVCGLQEIWRHNIGARWDLKEIRYHVAPATLAQCAKLGMSEDFAVTHLNQVIKEFGVFIEVNKTDQPRPCTLVRTIVDDILPLSMRETRELNRREISMEASVQRAPANRPL
jgi:hypothetical protein